MRERETNIDLREWQEQGQIVQTDRTDIKIQVKA